MFLFKKLLAPFLLPPGIFVTLALCAAAIRFRRSRGQAAAWAGFAVLMWAASLKPVGNAALRGVEYFCVPPAEVSADAAVVLSGGTLEGAPAPFGGAALRWPSMERAAEAARLYRRYGLPLVVTGGGGPGGASEAAAIRSYLISLGVPGEKIFAEEKARDTRENALFSKALCDAKGFRRVVLVTSAYHMRRAVWSFEKAGFAGVVPWPVSYATAPGGRYAWTDYLPGSFEMLGRAAHERLGLAFYRLQGRAFID